MTSLGDQDFNKIWRMAAWEMLKRGHLRYAVEAWQNSRKDHPPDRWSSGQRVA